MFFLAKKIPPTHFLSGRAKRGMSKGLDEQSLSTLSPWAKEMLGTVCRIWGWHRETNGDGPYPGPGGVGASSGLPFSCGGYCYLWGWPINDWKMSLKVGRASDESGVLLQLSSGCSWEAGSLACSRVSVRIAPVGRSWPRCWPHQAATAHSPHSGLVRRSRCWLGRSLVIEVGFFFVVLWVFSSNLWEWDWEEQTKGLVWYFIL